MTGLAGRKSFGSDNHAGTHPDVMRAIVEANAGDVVAYGADPWTERAVGELKRLTGAEGEVYLVLNGSGANVLGLGLLLGRHEAVICAETAHINTDECGAAERILGTKLLTVPVAGRQDHPRPHRPPSGRPRRRALRPAGRRRGDPVHRARHLLLPGRAARDQGVLRREQLARLPRRRSARERRRAPGVLRRRDRRVRRRAQLRRHQERRDGSRGRRRHAGRRTRSTRRTFASSTCSSPPRCASSPLSSTRC